jgi:hypothetical protein
MEESEREEKVRGGKRKKKGERVGEREGGQSEF